jgi:hypothetical protein
MKFLKVTAQQAESRAPFDSRDAQNLSKTDAMPQIALSLPPRPRKKKAHQKAEQCKNHK